MPLTSSGRPSVRELVGRGAAGTGGAVIWGAFFLAWSWCLEEPVTQNGRGPEVSGAAAAEGPVGG